MKKLLVLSFCALVCVALISCEKENNGKFNPKKKIQKVYYDNAGEKVLDQTWDWKGKLLSKIDYFYLGDEIWYTDYYFYDNKNRISILKEDDDYLEFVYEKNRIKTINYKWFDELEESYTMIYDKNKLSGIEWVQYDVSWIDDLLNNEHERRLSPLAELIPQGYENLEKAVRKMHSQKKGENDTLIMELTWEGKNVSHILAHWNGDLEETMEVSFTYDDKINPLKGWHPLWVDYVIGVWDDELYTYSSYGNVLTADYVYKNNGVEYDRVFTNYSYEYEGNYPIKVAATMNGETYFTRYYEY
ncbi:MAG: hypothetical protein K5882_01300 [Bacteroidales bacterium]|nr:hypothetical protein [Bacteroidales bacterium]